MELDELRSLLDRPLPERTQVQLSGILKQKSRSILQKIRRSMKLETICGIVFGIAAVIWFVMSDLLFYKYLAAIVGVFCFGFLIYIRSLFKKIDSLESSPQPVRENIEQIIRILEIFTRLYFQLTMLVMPLICIMGLIVIRQDKQVLFTNREWVFYIGWFIGWTVFMYFFTKWYLRVLYGNYLKELRKELGELGELESEKIKDKR